MNGIDLAIAFVLIVFALMGFVQGLIKQVGALVGYFVAVLIAARTFIPVGNYLKNSIEQWPPSADGLAMVIAFIGVFFLVSMLWGIVVDLVDKIFNFIAIIPFLKTINRVAGAVLGGIQGVLLLGAFLFIFSIYPLSRGFSEGLTKSTLAPQVVNASKLVLPFFPDVIKFAPSLFGITNAPKIDLNTVFPPKTSTKK